MPVNQTSYQNGKIYKIWSLETDRIYIGSTCDTLTNRMCGHRRTYKSWKESKINNVSKSAILFDLVGLENCKIELIHNFPCESKSELEAEEGCVMRDNKDLIVNRCIAGRSYKEWIDEHKEELKIKWKEYRDTHKEERKKDKKEYYENHKEAINIKQKQKMTCECGSVHRISDKERHLKKHKHQNFIKPQ